MSPYIIDPQQFANEQAMLQAKINQLEQQRNQQMGIYSGQNQQMQPQVPASNVNWIQVAGIEGARNQIVQPGHTAWMMDNNSPVFYVKSVDGMGSVTFKVFQFTEILPEPPAPAQNQQNTPSPDYVTRAEFNALLKRLGDVPKKEESE
nr:MAG TPA: hypothetical protein [Bacteriophage sp.]DAG85410.1 MAG TPA: hypothetical protein [Caudoviricetes sp.]